MMTTLFISFLVIVILGVPISIALGLSSVFALALHSNYDLVIVSQRMFSAVNSFPIMAIPFFMMAGTLMQGGGISKRIVRFCDVLVGDKTGGLAIVGILACMLFASISGSAVATVAAIGGLIIPEMIARKYPPAFATAIITAAGTMGPIIPPSIGFVLYAAMANVSVRDMFLGGYIPGFLMGISLMVYTYFKAKKGEFYKSKERATLHELRKITFDAFWALLTPIIIIGGIMGGIFSPTEAGAVGCVYAFLVGVFVYRELTMKELMISLREAAVASTVTLYLVATASIFSWILTAERVPQSVAALFLSLTENKYIILFLINMMLLVVGMFIDATPAVIMLAPIFVPLMSKIGVNLVHFGVFVNLNLCIGLLTPPVGACLFVGCRISKVNITELIKEILPMIAILVLVCLFVTFVPATVTYLPSLLR